MSSIDETSGAGNTTSANRTGQTDAADEAGETEQMGPTQEKARGKIPEDRTEYRAFRDDVLGADAGEARPSAAAAGESVKARELQAQQATQKGEMAERKQKLGEALDTQYEEMNMDWEADSGVLFDKWASAWQDQYSDRDSPSYDAQHSRKQLEDALYQNGRLMGDDAIEEVVGDHRERLETQDAFEGWGTDDVQEWEKGLTAFLKAQRAEQPVRQFEPPPIDDLPTPNRDLEERSFDNPEAIRRKVDQWEAEQLETLEERAEQGDLNTDATVFEKLKGTFGLGGNDEYKVKRDRIQEAADAYVNITVGDEDGNKHAFREQVDVGSTTVRPRDTYIRHLEENPGDLMGAYSVAEDSIRDANWDELMLNLANAAS